MNSSVLMAIVLTWVLMVPWLSLVVVSGIMAFKKWQKTNGSLKKQMFYFWFGALVVFTGDFIHTISATITTYTGDPVGSINVLGSIFEFRTFAMFFDGVVFMIYYGLWALFIMGISFVFSFLFFILSLGLRPINPKFAMFMIPKTFAYMTAFYYLIKGVIRPVHAV